MNPLRLLWRERLFALFVSAIILSLVMPIWESPSWEALFASFVLLFCSLYFESCMPLPPGWKKEKAPAGKLARQGA